jgi:hypothetical protein
MEKILRTALLLLLIIPFSCGKDNQPEIPYVYVSYSLYPNGMDYIPVSGYKYVNIGYRGVIVYRTSIDQFNVFERCCPYDPEVSAAVVRVVDGISAIDTCCGSRYSLFDGSPTGEGPSPYSLMQYHYTFDGDRLDITN